MNINKSILAGRLTNEVDLRYTPSGSAVVRFTIAVNRSFKREDGTRETDFVNCTMWGKRAEALANHFKKGDGIGITGRIQTGSYEGQDGKRVYTTEVVADDFSFGQKAGGASVQRGQQPSQPQNNQSYTRVEQDPFSSGGPIEVSEDDLPF